MGKADRISQLIGYARHCRDQIEDAGQLDRPLIESICIVGIQQDQLEAVAEEFVRLHAGIIARMMPADVLDLVGVIYDGEPYDDVMEDLLEYKRKGKR